VISDDFWMEKALDLAVQAQKKGEVPIGALIVCKNEVVGQGYNCPISTCDPSAHAEISALRAAAKNLENYRLAGCTLYVTLEPCMMCLGAMMHARISQLVFGAYDSKEGVVRKVAHRIKYVGGVLEENCSEILKQFFREKREQR
jgi:tRNA(adenine34) deaminase